MVAGREYPVNFGINYYYKFFLEATGIDLIEKGILSLNEASIKSFDYTAGFLYAGHKAHCKMVKKDCTLTYEDALDIVMCLSEPEASALFLECFALNVGMTVEEFKKVIDKANKEAKNPKAQAARKKAD